MVTGIEGLAGVAVPSGWWSKVWRKKKRRDEGEKNVIHPRVAGRVGDVADKRANRRESVIYFN